jgi:DNA/RNA-binding domain of Phe-tRNA-synthetase-like protein
MQLVPDGSVAERLGSFLVLGQTLSGIRVSSSPPDLTSYMRKVEEGVRSSVQLEALKDDPILRAYRDFFWKSGIDPTKTRPASEALIRRILRGNALPAINSFVDALNIASVETRIAFAAFDADRLAGRLELRLARAGESMLPIGHAERLILEGREIIIVDERRVIALYPHRDSEETKIIQGSGKALVLSCGVPGIGHGIVRASLQKCVATVARFCGGTLGEE